MSKENMSKKNILDYDEEKTIRPQNFTLTAMKFCGRIVFSSS